MYISMMTTEIQVRHDVYLHQLVLPELVERVLNGGQGSCWNRGEQADVERGLMKSHLLASNPRKS